MRVKYIIKIIIYYYICALYLNENIINRITNCTVDDSGRLKGSPIRISLKFGSALLYAKNTVLV